MATSSLSGADCGRSGRESDNENLKGKFWIKVSERTFPEVAGVIINFSLEHLLWRNNFARRKRRGSHRRGLRVVGAIGRSHNVTCFDHFLDLLPLKFFWVHFNLG